MVAMRGLLATDRRGIKRPRYTYLKRGSAPTRVRKVADKPPKRGLSIDFSPKGAASSQQDLRPALPCTNVRNPIQFRAISLWDPGEISLVKCVMPIRRLDPVLVDRIAAGEVIERPTAVVKELVENALDAGSSRIDVAIESGGRHLIRVTDNGSGMPPEDLELAVERHATSKLPADDLSQIATLGFRGEALPSIGSVALLEIFSRVEGWPHGFAIRVDQGAKRALAPCSQPQGTRVEVHDLFTATPARLKFLKSERAEARACADAVQRLAMAHSHVRFTFASTDTAGFDYLPHGEDGDALLVRIADVLGREFRANALRVEAAREDFRLEGYAGLPTWHKANAQAQYLFVNGRPVRDKLLSGAVRAAYMDYVPQARHPALALFVTCDPREVDVNVHPAKAEVRFRDSGLVRGLLIDALKQSLQEALHRATPAHGKSAIDALAQRASHGRAKPTYAAPSTDWDWRKSPAYRGFAEDAPQISGDPALISETLAADTRTHAQVPAPEDIDAPLGAARAQIHECYIVAQTRDGIVIVDQHAAHERLVYERLKAARAGSNVPRQALLVPVIVEMEQCDVERIEDASVLLAEFGLVVEPFGPGAVAVYEMPTSLKSGDAAGLIRDLAATLREDEHSLAPLEMRLDHVLATMACHHSVRSGRRLGSEEMNALLREIERTPGSGQCNHGRPVYVELKLTGIEKLFGRR
jgi:DNA mismatch repair protein MutL